jgi:tetratricopeptide (TPR) repeat protein
MERRAIPQPALLPGGFEGSALLDELRGRAEAAALFQRARDVALWIITPPDQRYRLLGNDRRPVAAADHHPVEDRSGAEGDQALSGPLQVLDTLVTNPAGVDAAALADACAAVSAWAGECHFATTAISFAELAAAAVPDPLLAVHAGRLNRRYALYERARHWYEHASDVGRIGENRVAQAVAHLSWGNLEFQRGRHIAARRQFIRAWRVAKKFHLREEGGAARHNLMTLALEQGRYEDAQEHAVAAFRFYGRGYPRIPYFAHDVAQLWSWQRYYDAAIPIFIAAKDLIVPKERLKCLANLGRAAAGVGDASTFFESWDAVGAFDGPATEDMAEVFVNIGHGALDLGLYSRAHEVGIRALTIARQRGEISTEAQAEALLARVREQDEPLPPRPAPDSVRALSRWVLKAIEGRPFRPE